MIRFLLFMSCFLTSCSIYQRDFDCKAAEGVPCTSVTTLEKMIVESPCGPDTFLGCVPKLVDVQRNPSCRIAADSTPDAPFQRRIWVSPKEGRATYIYFQEDLQCEEL